MHYIVTIAIPVYKADGYIAQTMDSALSQTFPSIEYLILDDCGSDGSMDVVEGLKATHPRGCDIRILRHDRNRGVGVARNRLLEEAQGHYFFFLDSDDVIEPDTIERMVAIIRKYKAEVVYGSWERVDNVGHTLPKNYVYPYTELFTPDALALYAFKNYSTFRISVCNCLFDMAFLHAARLQFIDTFFWEDLAFTYELVTKVSRAVLLPDITYHYLCRPGSLSHYQNREQLQQTEILKNVSIIEHLKEMCAGLRGKAYLPYLCYNLEMNSFYIVCHVLRHRRRVTPSITTCQLRQFMCFPLFLSDVLHFRQKKVSNLILWLIAHQPTFLFVPIVRIMGRMKRIL